MSDEQQENPEAVKNNILKAQAVRQAMVEFIGENRTEIVKRARAKLVSMGIDLADEEAIL